MKRTLRYILSAAMLSAASIVLLLTSCSREERLENMTVNFHGRDLPAPSSRSVMLPPRWESSA